MFFLFFKYKCVGRKWENERCPDGAEGRLPLDDLVNDHTRRIDGKVT